MNRKKLQIGTFLCILFCFGIHTHSFGQEIKVHTLDEYIKALWDTTATNSAIKNEKSTHTVTVVAYAPSNVKLPDTNAWKTIRGYGDEIVLKYASSQKADKAVRILKNTKGISSVEKDTPLEMEQYEKADKMMNLSSFNVKKGSSTKRTTIVAVCDSGFNKELITNSDRVLWDKAIDLIGDGIRDKREEHHGSYVTDIILSITSDNVKVLPIKVIKNNGKADSVAVAQGIRKAVEMGADVINISLAGRGSSVSMAEATTKCQKMGVPVIAAAGNGGSNVSNYVPASLDGVCAVASVNENGQPSTFSNHGAYIDLAMLGEGIVVKDKAKPVSGTSFSAPFVTSAVATLQSYGFHHPVETLEYYADDINDPGYDEKTGYGLVNLDHVIEDLVDADMRYQHEKTVDVKNSTEQKNLKIETTPISYGEPFTSGVTNVYYQNKKLVNGTDYLLVAAEENMVEHPAVTLIGRGMFTGQVSIPVQVFARQLDNIDVDIVKGQVSVEQNGVPLIEGFDYDVSYEYSKDTKIKYIVINGINHYIGTAKLAIQRKKNYTRNK